MKRAPSPVALFTERSFILGFLSLYMIVFNITIPHGDALRIERQIAANELIWNPNHLLLDPFGYLWTHTIKLLGLNISVLGGFELISALATLGSLYLFHKILLALEVDSAWIRGLAVLGLFSSKNFLSMALSQYFFMLQMPFLLGAIYFGIRLHSERQRGLDGSISLYAMGLLMAVATGIEINNVVPILVVGITLVFSTPGTKSFDYLCAFKFWGAAAALGFPIFIAGYMLSGTGDGFFAWLTAYQGEADSSLDNYYGTQMTMAGILSSGASLLFHLFLGNMVETAGLGTILKTIAFDQPLEFVPDPGKIVLGVLLTPIITIGLLSLFGWALLYKRRHFLVRLYLSWIGAYLLFNFFWPYTSDLFWFQMLPLVWLLIVSRLIVLDDVVNGMLPAIVSIKRSLLLFTIGVSCLMVLNTLQTIIPLSLVDIDKYATEHSTLFEEGDMEIVPGWDNYKWMMQQETDDAVRKMLLMNMALQQKTDELYIDKLPMIIRAHLQTGRRVIVGRLYDLDRESNPWYGLADLGWPRKKIQEMLGGFCKQRLAVIDDVSFYKLELCANGKL